MAPCILAITFASTFSVIFPLIGPAVVLLVFLTLVGTSSNTLSSFVPSLTGSSAHRFLVGYVYGRTRSQTGGLLQIWLLKRFASLLAIQPILLGLIFFSRRLWPEGVALVGAGGVIVVFVEVYTRFKERRMGRGVLSPVSQHAVESFRKSARPERLAMLEKESPSLVNSGRAARTRGSYASVLEMMSTTLAVVPSRYQQHGPVPLRTSPFSSSSLTFSSAFVFSATETLDDLTATERAARTHPDAPPLPLPLPFTDHAEEMSSILFAPELIVPPPIVWLPNDNAGVARAEARDLEQFHGLKAVIEVRLNDNVILQRHQPHGISS